MTRTVPILFGLSLLAAPTLAWANPKQCVELPEGGVVEPARDLFSSNGVLNVNLHYRTSLNLLTGRTLFCFQTDDGAQSPTLHVRPGDTLNLTVHNELPALPAGSPTRVVSGRSNTCGAATMTETSMNVHFHGTNTAPTCGSDEVIHTLVNAGDTFHYHLKFPADEPSGLYWYHPHVHGLAEQAVIGGASGLVVVDGIERVQPELAGLPERILTVRDQLIMDNANSGPTVPSWDLSLNGVPILYPSYRPAVIRMPGRRREFWRLANASADTPLDLFLAYDGVLQPLEVVALDGVSIGSQDENRHGHPTVMRHIVLPPGGRAEFVIPAPAADTKVAVLRTRNVDMGPAGDVNPARLIARLAFDDAAAPRLDAVPMPTGSAGPQRFDAVEFAPTTARRKLYFSEVEDPNNYVTPVNYYLTVDGQKPVSFDAGNPPAIVTRQGAVEEWTIENRSPHTHEFHIHQVHFEVLQPNGARFPRSQRQFRDTVQVPYWTGSGPYPSVRMRVDFRASLVGDFVYHCHILEHEDNGMMGVIRVTPAER